MDNDLISRSALLEKFCTNSITNKITFSDGKSINETVEAAPAVDAVEIGSCEGCMWENRKRPQKCSCCRRNPDMKDCYEERRTE